MGAVPEFESVTGTVALLPIAIPPKGMLEGAAVRVPSTPFPATGIDMVGSVAFVVTVTLPDSGPVLVGVNVITNDAVPPAAMI
jgi:hypothetical protein